MGVSDIAHELNFLFFNDFAALTPTPLPKGLEQLAQRQALLAKQEREAYPPNGKPPLKTRRTKRKKHPLRLRTIRLISAGMPKPSIKEHPMNKTLTVALILATLPAVRAADSTEIRLGLATGMAPEYPGSDRYRASVNKNRAPALPTLSIQRRAQLRPRPPRKKQKQGALAARLCQRSPKRVAAFSALPSRPAAASRMRAMVGTVSMRR